MSILDLLFGNSNEPEDHSETTVVETSTGWTGTYPGELTEEVAEIFEENGYAVVEEEEQEEEEAQPWWKLW